MQIPRICYLIIAFFVMIGFAMSQSVKAPFSLTISALKPSVLAGSDVWIKIDMTNTSKHDVDCSSVFVNGSDRRYQYDVRDANAKSMKKLNEHPENVPGSVQLCTLKPGETVSHDSRISWLHDFSKPGAYQIQVSRGVSDNEKDGVVKSNTITINVTQ